ncbi:rasGEF domain-containing protein [Naegleria gruberi]|uniref:RasGEF domain-containing protein n=1 Tax=Naegleria gruberi TaxID=5762 RepID=D2VDQ2_NAEGR|nr:rasGEF domain-containing protein [Naegleria gruberi]EFC45042.1 rasGEF domain-containing protein [Naegleria gruberi]|eukprot:XP_002677786.1 rasGEF domain-containing protein [Naegleria gruberi strain NEG-M]
MVQAQSPLTGNHPDKKSDNNCSSATVSRSGNAHQQQGRNSHEHLTEIDEEVRVSGQALEEFESLVSLKIKAEQQLLSQKGGSKKKLSEVDEERRSILLLLFEKYLREKGLSKSAEILRMEKHREQLELEGFTPVKNQFSVSKELESNVDQELVTQYIGKTEKELEQLSITEFPYHRTMFTSHFEKVKNPSTNLELKVLRSNFDLENVLLSAAIKTNSAIINEKLGLINEDTLDLSNLDSLELELSKPIHTETVLRYINAATSDNLKPIDKICLMYQNMGISSGQFFTCLSSWLSSSDDKVTETKANAYRALKHWLQKYYLYYTKFDLEGVQAYTKLTCTLRTFIRSNEGKLKRISQTLGDNFDLEKFVSRTNSTFSYSQMLTAVERTIQQKMSRSSKLIECITQIETKSFVSHLSYLFGRLFLRIEPQELFGANWTKSRKKYQCPNIIDNIDFFNTYSLWFASLIVQEEQLERRVAVLEYLINLAMCCANVGNYGALYAIASAIRNGSVFRMKQTFDSISESSKKEYEKLQQIISTDMNSANYTKQLRETYEKALSDFSICCIPNLVFGSSKAITQIHVQIGSG